MPLNIKHKLWVQQDAGGDRWIDCQPGHDDPDEARAHVRECRNGMPYDYRVVARTTIVHEGVVDPARGPGTSTEQTKKDLESYCFACGGKGVVQKYFDAGDHFGGSSAPGSGWENVPCDRCQGKK